MYFKLGIESKNTIQRCTGIIIVFEILFLLWYMFL